uniref:ATP synthase F0 subunit 8 n=1 Tax=Strongylium nakanei TaxID=2969967 RepID=UPI002176BAF4|nr:ATP synthase F0 subunit 8 [Strongylium nakanei]UUL71681.1 ATP synthase F0 subunit 8 [Strongylium nakanei]
MPQMAPLNWLSLMIMFVLVLIMFNMLNFFSFNYQVKQKTLEIEKTQINWKW